VRGTMDLNSTAQLLGNFGEFVSSIAIFVTLGYLAVQVRAGRIATVADHLSVVQSNNQLMLNQTIENSDLLARANAGKPLNDADQIAFESLVQTRNLNAFLHYRRSKLLRTVPQIPALNFARFLLQHPAAYHAWNGDQAAYHRAIAAAGMTRDAQWSEAVMQMIDRLVEAGVARHPEAALSENDPTVSAQQSASTERSP
jgi:hypothetical protein